MTPHDPATDPELAADYQALTSGCALVELGPRTELLFTGRDRATLVNNLSTNEIRKLEPGRGAEVFLLNVQGRIVGHGYVFAGAERHLLNTVPGQGERLLAHCDRYIIREDVQVADRTAEITQWGLLGPLAEATAARALGAVPWGNAAPAERLAHGQVEFEGEPIKVRRVDWTSPVDLSLVASCERAEALREALVAAGARPVSVLAFEAARIEAGTPFFGGDIGDRNLPQELARDDRAISFVKGCYLGQETVARIDALGHVNRTLVGIEFPGSVVPGPGTELTVEGQVVGQVTSAGWSPRRQAAVALAYLRRGVNQPGQAVNWPGGSGRVFAFSSAG